MIRHLKHLLGSLNWGIILTLLVSFTFWGCFAGILHAQDSTKTYTVTTVAADAVTYQELDEDLGITTCYNGKVSSFVRIGIPASEAATTIVHEMKHQEQFDRFAGDCKRFREWYQTPAGKLASEAEAYMADYCVAVKLGKDPLYLRKDYAERISRYFGGEANRLEIISAMNRYDACPQVIKQAVLADPSVMPGWGSDSVSQQ